MTSMLRWMTWLACLALVGSLVGCHRASTSPSSNSPAQAAPGESNGEPGSFAAGKKVFAANCARCHMIAGAGASSDPGGPGPKMGRGKGPELTTVARDPAHTVAWLQEHIRNP